MRHTLRARLGDRLHVARDDDGTALVEFFWLGILLMVPITYAILFAFQMQRAVFAVTEATRSAGRAYVSTPNGDTTTAGDRATTAASLTMTDHGLPFTAANFTVTCMSRPGSDPPKADTCFTADHWVRVTIHVPVQLPLLGALHINGGTVGVGGQHDELFDKYADYATNGP
jgi:hypothetical protein